MHSEYRQKLLAILSRRDRLETEANEILAEPGDTENSRLAEELRELIVVMQARVEGKLDRS